MFCDTNTEITLSSFIEICDMKKMMPYMSNNCAGQVRLVSLCFFMEIPATETVALLALLTLGNETLTELILITGTSLKWPMQVQILLFRTFLRENTALTKLPVRQ
jgi:hypothetical protein